MPGIDEEAYMKRAMSAFARTSTILPTYKESCIWEHEGLNYAVLRNSYKLLAVYRITNAGQLKRLKRWPEEFEER